MALFIPVIVGTVARYAVGGVITYVVGKEVVAVVNQEAGESIEDVENSILMLEPMQLKMV